jgi:hypothetical protein
MGRSRGMIETKLRDDRFDDFARMGNDGNGNRTFVGLRLFQGLELAVEERRGHEVIGARGEPAGNEIAVAFEENDAHVAPAADKNIAIGALERRAGNDAVLAVQSRRVDPLGNGAQLRPAIRVIERFAVMHLLDVRLRMEPVTVFVDPMKAMREHSGDGAFARPGDAHHDQDGRQ